MFYKRCWIVAAIFVFLAGYHEAQATPITYTFSATGAGNLGSNAFNTQFVITSTADTSQITNPMSGLFLVPDITATVFITGLGTATFTIPTTNVSNNSMGTPIVVFSSPTQNLLILGSFGNPAYGTYALNTSIGPLTGSAAFNSVAQFPVAQFATNLGNFSLTNVSGEVTFQAAVPEPPTIVMVVVGIALCLCCKRRRIVESS
jgi:hypothetical protein